MACRQALSRPFSGAEPVKGYEEVDLTVDGKAIARHRARLCTGPASDGHAPPRKRDHGRVLRRYVYDLL
jgi:hypothetical protein